MAAHTQKTPYLFRLPLEVRHQIYQSCYLPPHSWPTCAKDSSSRAPQSKYGRFFVGQYHCQVPYSHESLLLVSRQLHADYFPIFAQHHTMSFCKPLVFANEYLSFLTPQRLAALRHLRISWPPSDTALLNTDPTVYPDLKKLHRVWKAYPELATNIESFVLDLPLYHATVSANMRVLFTSVVGLIESYPLEHERSFLIILRGPTVGTAQICVRSVPRKAWDKVVNGLVREEKSQTRNGRGPALESSVWFETVAFTAFSQSGSAMPTVPLTTLQSGKAWKVVYQQNEPICHPWVAVLEEVEKMEAARLLKVKKRNQIAQRQSTKASSSKANRKAGHKRLKESHLYKRASRKRRS